ncbi:MAG: hypothetical protein IPK50_17430 [Fibrobacterota bacterium]|nr:hypothetical protein [Fibrobacterota bacterium]QQS04058.1 MAG: hypothetical protein IPK50_17430 [Fibrobacterota bacterium]
MTWLFALLVLGGIAAMAWSFLAAARLEASVSDLEERLAAKTTKTEDKK